ncbi:MAG TPA: DMT family transporter [Bdellovibrionales bacterium]|nr:DMT family transporter [Bdellovibrionales bacterium]
MSPHLKSVLQALFVTLLWSSSWVFIKVGLQGLPPLTFAGLRYFLGFLFLLPLVWIKDRSSFKTIRVRQWVELLVLGIVMYVLTQGAQFLSLNYFPAVLTALILNITPVVIAVFSVFLLKEAPNRQQVIGMGVCLLGAFIYLWPRLGDQIALSWLLLIPVGGMLANALSSLLGRAVNRREHFPARVVTVISMGIGSILLLSFGLMIEPVPQLGFSQILIVVWLAGINTAFAFTLWNHTLRSLSSVESSVINNTMMIQIAVLAVVVLGEKLSVLDVIALIIAAFGSLLVQLRKKSAS